MDERTICITGADLVLPDRVLESSNVSIKGERILGVGEEPPPGAEVIDASGLMVLPGLVDIHTHGRLGLLDPETVADRLAKDCMDNAGAGVTGFLPTLASAPVAAWLECMPALAEAVEAPPPGARPLGVHLEGTFINVAAAGAQPPAHIKPFDPGDPDHSALFEDWAHLIKVVSFAPEVPGNRALIGLCKEQGIIASIAHSTASPEQVREFAEQGMTHVTHIFNGMKLFHHREPGPSVAGLLDPGMSVEVICDGRHLHPDVVKLIHRLKPPEKRVLVSDSVTIELPGSEPGRGEEPNRLPDGRLAGSRLRLCSAVKNYARFTGCPLHEAAAMASLYPAKIIGLDSEIGSIEPGKKADLWIAGRDLVPRQVFIRGARLGPAGQ